MCNIGAYIPKDGININWAEIKLALLLGESRGRQSTGIGATTGSYKAVKAAEGFIEELLITEYELSAPILWHNRAPSMGTARTVDAAQPILLTDEDDKVDFLLVHNGTIHNMEELAADANVKFDTNDTDSQILAKMLKDEHYDVLDKYHGAASLIWIRHDDPTAIYMFRGTSAASSYVSYSSEERPLNVVDTDRGRYLMSTSAALKTLMDTQGDKTNVTEVVENTVIRYDGEETIIYTADRSDVYQSKKFTTSATRTNSTYNTYGANNYDYYDTHNYESPEISVGDYNKMEYQITDIHWINMISETSDDKLLIDEKAKATALDYDDVFFMRGLYRRKSMVLNGAVRIKDNKLSSIHTPGFKIYVFVKGVLLKSNITFIEAYAAAGKFNYGTSEFQEAIAPFADQPVVVLETYQDIAIETIYYGELPFTGVYKPKFKNRGVIEVHMGNLATTVMFPTTVLDIGDKVEVLMQNTFREGTITSIDEKLGVFKMITKSNEDIRVDDYQVTKVVLKTIPILATENPFIEDAKVTEDKVDTHQAELALINEAVAKRKKESENKVINDMLSIMKDAQEEIKLGLDSAKAIHVKLPKVNKRIHNLMNHAIQSLTTKD